jgi:hypothetical protein
MHSKSAWTFFVCFGCVVALVGCGPKTGKVSGKITYNGEPLPNGVIVFAEESQLEEGEPYFGHSDIGPKGSYSVRTLVGPNLIRLRSLDLTPEEKELVKEGGAPPEIMAKTLIPRIYSDFKFSNLTFDVQEGTNTYDIELTGEVDGGRVAPRR